MKKIIALMMSVLLAAVMLVSCKSDESAVSDYAKKLNSDDADTALSMDGIDLEFEARGTKLAVVVMPERTVFNRTPAEQYPLISKDLSKVIPVDTIERECPEVTAVIVEVKDPDGQVVFSEEI